MLAVADAEQQGFFDAAWCGNVVLRDSFYGLLAEHGERLLCDEDFADCYSERQGRPSIPPSILAKILLLEYRSGLSDRQAMEAVRFDLRWKVALGLPLDHEGFHPTSLVSFALACFCTARSVSPSSARFGSPASLACSPRRSSRWSTRPRCSAPPPPRTRLPSSAAAVRKLLDAVSGEDSEAAAQLDRNLVFDYAKPRQKPDCEWRSKPAREALLTRVAQDAERALRAVEQLPALAAAKPVAEAAQLLRELIGQDFELDEDDVPRLRCGTAKGRILSVHDPEMRHGRKSQRQRFDGYKLHATATTGPQPLLTAIEVAPASESDREQAPALIDSQPDTIRPAFLLGDSAYGDQETRERMEAREVEVLAPVPEPPPPAGRFGKRDFRIDLAAGTVTCPAGHSADIPAQPAPSGLRHVSFPRAVCRACSLAQPCLASDGRRRLVLERREDLREAGRQALRDPPRREHLRRTRPRIERLLGLLTHRYHGRKSRYRGKRKAAFQASWTAVLVNLHPIGAELQVQAA